MKYIIPILCIFHISGCLAQTEVELFFFDPCTNKIFQEEFSLVRVDGDNPFMEYYESNKFEVIVPDGNYSVNFVRFEPNNPHVVIGCYYEAIPICNITKYIDTVRIPRILPECASTYMFQRTHYYNCYRLCNGFEVDYYPNGNKRIEGHFYEGKPNWIINYRETGTINYKEYYDFKSGDLTKEDYYDDNGAFDTTVIYIKPKKIFVETVSDSAGRLLQKDLFNIITAPNSR
jgi:hypothetical protein